MEARKKIFIENVLGRLDFVKWDRYFEVGEELITFFGWIDKSESYKDFLVVDFWFREKELMSIGGFVTSSKEHSKRIANILGVEHSVCERVENFCDLNNVIRLENDK